MTDNTTPIPGLTPERVREVSRELMEPIARGDLVETMAVIATYIVTHEQRIVNLEQRAPLIPPEWSGRICICDGSGWKHPTLLDPTLERCPTHGTEETR